MKSVRLLPVVVFSIGALLVFKSIGIVTDGGYVLKGVGVAQGATPEAPVPAMGQDPTLNDSSPTLIDPAPTIPGLDIGAPAPPPAAPLDLAATDGPRPDCAVQLALPGESADAADTGVPDCVPLVDGVPMQEVGIGAPVPLTGADGGSLTQAQLLERLGQRRDELEAWAQELDMRAALVDAAEKRLEERLALLEATRTQIEALVAERDATEAAQFQALVGMYETMKPAEAARIFDDLDMSVLLRVARTMNPRKMAPIMAKMNSVRAQELTVGLAAIEPDPRIAIAEDPDQLPQIVGQ